MKPIETPGRQRIVNFRRGATPVAIWSGCALFVALIIGIRAGQMEYIVLSQVLEEWNALKAGAPAAVADAATEDAVGEVATAAKGEIPAADERLSGMLAAPALAQPLGHPRENAPFANPNLVPLVGRAIERLEPVDGFESGNDPSAYWSEPRYAASSALEPGRASVGR